MQHVSHAFIHMPMAQPSVTARPEICKALSVVIPCFNEEAGLDELVRRVSAACDAAVGENFEIVLVNDGSADGTWPEMLRQASLCPQLVCVDLSHNHGQQLALTAGLFLTRGERIFILDADLQDPPELLPDMMRMIDDGVDVVYGQRLHRDGESWFKKASASMFYKIMRKLTDAPIPADTGDFRLITRQVLDVLLNMPEQHRFIRGMVAWIGFRQKALPYSRKARFTGRSKYPLKRMLAFAVDGITGFSVAPLRLSLYLGCFAIFGAFLIGLYGLWSLWTGATRPGWASIMFVILTFGAMQMFCLSILGEYIGRTYMQTKQRPLFIIRSVHQQAKL